LDMWLVARNSRLSEIAFCWVVYACSKHCFCVLLWVLTHFFLQ
jgi:hypothetical protein